MKKSLKKNLVKELAEELDAFDDMLSTLIELLEQKGIVTQKEFENNLRVRVAKRGKKTSYRNLQFRKDDL